jgi:hypothetical protein
MQSFNNLQVNDITSQKAFTWFQYELDMQSEPIDPWVLQYLVVEIQLDTHTR